MSRLHQRARLAAPLLLLLSLLAGAFPVRAHTLSVSHLDIRMLPQGGAFPIELDLSLRDLALTFPLDADRDERVTWGELTAIRAEVERSIRANVILSAAGTRCALEPGRLAVRRYDDGAYATFLMTARCASRDGLRLQYTLFAQDPQHRALVTLRGGAVVATAVAGNAGEAVAVGAGNSRPFVQFLREGVHHILIGYDHLAFLLSLLLPAVLTRRERTWAATPGFHTSLMHVVGVVTAFTVAHSITLSLAALGWVRPASRWVEAAIAASVLLAALNNVWPMVTRRVWIVGFLFGLVHGFGFAGVLAELGLPRGARLQALFGFNLGVELGQLAVVAVVLPLIHLLRRQPWYARVAMPLTSAAIAALAAWWLFQRLFAVA